MARNPKPDPRAEFLRPLIPALEVAFPQLACHFEGWAPYSGTHLVLHQGPEKILGIGAVTLFNGGRGIDLEHFPSRYKGGVPHWQIVTPDFDSFYTCDAQQVIRWVGRWLQVQQTEAEAPPPLQLVQPPDLRAWLHARPAPQSASWAEPAAWPDNIDTAFADAAKADLAAVDKQRVARQFPRDAKGRIAKNTRVTLAAYGQIAKGPNKRQWLLCATAVAAGRLQLGVNWLIAENQNHDWRGDPWRWRKDAPWPDDATRWGIANDPRAAQALAALDAGRYDQALALYGIAHGPRMACVLHGRPLDVYDAHLAEKWAGELALCLARLAPWRLAQVPPLETRSVRLLLLSGQTSQQKAALVLCASGKKHQTLRLEVEFSASNNRVPENRFLRDLDQDQSRLLG